MQSFSGLIESLIVYLRILIENFFNTIIMVSNGNQLNVGILIEINGIVEFHYISINLH